ncbi:MAG: hypothetical protein H8E62_03705 [Planctomycetes bacterium]|nr:hypothetical protein [Planctomycetota bacterium]
MKKLWKAILITIRTIAAPIAAYLVMYLLLMIPIWGWGWAVRPIDITSISVLKIVIIIVGAFILLSVAGYWIMALWLAPAALHKAISPPIRWLRVTTASILSAWIIIGQIITSIAGRCGLMTNGYGEIIVMPIGLIIYMSICILISTSGLIILAVDDS